MVNSLTRHSQDTEKDPVKEEQGEEEERSGRSRRKKAPIDYAAVEAKIQAENLSKQQGENKKEEEVKEEIKQELKEEKKEGTDATTNENKETAKEDENSKENIIKDDVKEAEAKNENSSIEDEGSSSSDDEKEDKDLGLESLMGGGKNDRIYYMTIFHFFLHKYATNHFFLTPYLDVQPYVQPYVWPAGEHWPSTLIKYLFSGENCCSCCYWFRPDIGYSIRPDDIRTNI